MAKSNLRIVNDLKVFMQQICDDNTLKGKYVYGKNDFSRQRILCFKTTVLLLLNTLKRSLSIELHEFFENFSQKGSCSKQAFSKQRRKLKPDFFHDWNTVLVDSFYRNYIKECRRWKGLKIWAIDGSSVSLPDIDLLRNKYGQTTNQQGAGGSVARICVIYDVLNEIAIQGLLHPYTVSEEVVIPDILKDKDTSDTLILFDRGYPSYWLMHQLIAHNTFFVMRAACNANNVVKSFLAGEQDDLIVEMRPPYSSIIKLKEMGVSISKEKTIRIRLVKFLLDSGQVEVLITNLYDVVRFPLKDLKQLYNMRWGIETYYGYMKQELQLAQFSGLAPICIEQDFAANLFLFNLQSLIEKQCAIFVEDVGEKRMHKQKVNKNISWALLKHRVVRLFLTKKPKLILNELQELFCSYLEPVRPGRKYPRIKKRTPNSKHYTLTNYKRAI
jgi:Transposase DDE domain